MAGINRTCSVQVTLTRGARRPAGAPVKTLVKVVSIMAFSGACAGLLVRAPRGALRLALL